VFCIDLLCASSSDLTCRLSSAISGSSLDHGLMLVERLLQALDAFPHVSESEAVDWMRRGAPFVVIPGNTERSR